jgi:hypothetical protein
MARRRVTGEGKGLTIHEVDECSMAWKLEWEMFFTPRSPPVST